jgi:hypothetical protein
MQIKHALRQAGGEAHAVNNPSYTRYAKPTRLPFVATQKEYAV